MANLASSFLGIKSPNFFGWYPFLQQTNNIMLKEHLKGWGGVKGKTLGAEGPN